MRTCIVCEKKHKYVFYGLCEDCLKNFYEYLVDKFGFETIFSFLQFQKKEAEIIIDIATYGRMEYSSFFRPEIVAEVLKNEIRLNKDLQQALKEYCINDHPDDWSLFLQEYNGNKKAG